MISIAIDGESGAGKSTVADILSRRLNILHLNSGALYRAVGLYVYEHNIDPKDENAVVDALKDIKITIKYVDGAQRTILNGKDVSSDLYTSEMGNYSSLVSQYPVVRDKITAIQREIANEHDIIIEGRDITSAVLPDATYKFYITGTPEVRAKRRLEDLRRIGEAVTYEEVYQDIIERDKRDTTRSYHPLIRVEDAVYIETDELTAEQVADKMLAIIKK